MSHRLLGKTALITGGSRGIGRAVADAYAAEGADIFLCARNAAHLAEATAQIRDEHGVAAHGFACDVADREAVFAMVHEAERIAPIDVLVNNAGVYSAGAFANYDFDAFRHVMEVNVYGVVHVTQAVLGGMLERRAGRVINLASTAGKWGTRNQSAYNASKHAVIGLTRCLSLEVAPHNILVNAICPWIVDTELGGELVAGLAEHAGIPLATFSETLQNSVPLKRWVRPQEVAKLAVYLASDDASYINGQAWAVDGGYTMM